MADENQAPEDVYPLGQGGGLFKDVINFALNNLYQYGQKLGSESQKNASILEGMRSGDPTARVSTAGLQPMMGPNVVGQISPTNWANYSPEAKAILTETFNKFPRLFQRVQKTPSNLHVSVGNENALAQKSASGLMRSVNPYYDEIQLAKTQRIGNQPSKTAVGDSLNWHSIAGEEMRPDLQTTVHELQHHVNQPRLQQVRPEDAADQATIGMLLKDLMYNKDIGSLQNRFDQYRLALGDKPTWNRDIVSPHAKGASGYDFRSTPWSQFLGGSMADEGLAYLANNSINDPKLAALAEKLGVNPGAAPQSLAASAPNVRPGPLAPSLMDEVWSSINSMRDKLSGQSTEKQSAAGGNILQKLYKDRVEEASKLGIKDPINQDSFMSEILRNLSAATHYSPQTPLGTFRRFQAPAANKGNMITKPLDTQSTIDLLSHLRQYGLLDKANLDRATQGTIGAAMPLSPPASGLSADAFSLERIKALLDRLEGRTQ